MEDVSSAVIDALTGDDFLESRHAGFVPWYSSVKEKSWPSVDAALRNDKLLTCFEVLHGLRDIVEHAVTTGSFVDARLQPVDPDRPAILKRIYTTGLVGSVRKGMRLYLSDPTVKVALRPHELPRFFAIWSILGTSPRGPSTVSYSLYIIYNIIYRVYGDMCCPGTNYFAIWQKRQKSPFCVCNHLCDNELQLSHLINILSILRDYSATVLSPDLPRTYNADPPNLPKCKHKISAKSCNTNNLLICNILHHRSGMAIYCDFQAYSQNGKPLLLTDSTLLTDDILLRHGSARVTCYDKAGSWDNGMVVPMKWSASAVSSAMLQAGRVPINDLVADPGDVMVRMEDFKCPEFIDAAALNEIRIDAIEKRRTKVARRVRNKADQSSPASLWYSLVAAQPQREMFPVISLIWKALPGRTKAEKYGALLKLGTKQMHVDPRQTWRLLCRRYPIHTVGVQKVRVSSVRDLLLAGVHLEFLLRSKRRVSVPDLSKTDLDALSAGGCPAAYRQMISRARSGSKQIPIVVISNDPKKITPFVSSLVGKGLVVQFRPFEAIGAEEDLPTWYDSDFLFVFGFDSPVHPSLFDVLGKVLWSRMLAKKCTFLDVQGGEFALDRFSWLGKYADDNYVMIAGARRS